MTTKKERRRELVARLANPEPFTRPLAPFVSLGDGYMIQTDPGCDDELHRLEVFGAMWALHESGPWPGPTDMDCGCVLELVRLP